MTSKIFLTLTPFLHLHRLLVTYLSVDCLIRYPSSDKAAFFFKCCPGGSCCRYHRRAYAGVWPWVLLQSRIASVRCVGRFNMLGFSKATAHFGGFLCLFALSVNGRQQEIVTFKELSSQRTSRNVATPINTCSTFCHRRFTVPDTLLLAFTVWSRSAENTSSASRTL